MQRLTECVSNKCYLKNPYVENYKIFDKLGKLEDTEEKLGVTLEVLFRALDSSTYIYTKHQVYTNRTIREFNWHDNCIKFYDYYWNSLGAIMLNEFGKEWAFTMKDLDSCPNCCLFCEFYKEEVVGNGEEQYKIMYCTKGCSPHKTSYLNKEDLTIPCNHFVCNESKASLYNKNIQE